MCKSQVNEELLAHVFFLNGGVRTVIALTVVIILESKKSQPQRVN